VRQWINGVHRNVLRAECVPRPPAEAQSEITCSWKTDRRSARSCGHTEAVTTALEWDGLMACG